MIHASRRFARRSTPCSRSRNGKIYAKRLNHSIGVTIAKDSEGIYDDMSQNIRGIKVPEMHGTGPGPWMKKGLACTGSRLSGCDGPRSRPCPT